MLGSLLEARRDPLQFTLRLTREFGGVARFHLGVFKGYLVSHPEGVSHVLQSNHRNYDKKNYDYDMLRPFLGEGLLTADGDHWLNERRLIQPCFHQEHLDNLVPMMHRVIQRRLNSWEPLAEENAVINLSREMNRLALEVLANTLLGAELPSLEPILDAFEVLNDEVSRRLQSLFVPPLWVPTLRNFASRRARSEIEAVLRDFVLHWEAERRPGSLIETLIQAHGGPAGDGSLPRAVRDEMVTLTLAGHETTAALLSWTWHLLSEHPQIAQSVRSEAREVLEDSDLQPKDLERLDLTERVLKEALRLYPPVWIISRRTKQEDFILGYRIPADSVVALSPYATHRHPDHWEQPELFDPERFSPKRQRERPPFAYFPFGGGPRLCIGGGFAMMEAKMVLASTLERYELRLIGDEKVRPKALITLRPAHDLRAKLHPIRS